jgi:short-chain Z-isoprenyl diphosphate synthase
MEESRPLTRSALRSGAAARRPLRDLIKAPLYYLYEQRLLAGVRQGAVPRHIALILDGNRRYARAAGQADPEGAYRAGADKIDEVLRWCEALQVSTLTMWVLSIDNLGRDSEELAALLGVIEDKVEALARHPHTHLAEVRIRALGRLDLLPERTQAVLQEAAEATARYTRMTLNIAVGYGGREEIADAVRDFLAAQQQAGRSLDEAIAAITPEGIGRHVYAHPCPDPDLIIRTSGEVRLSGFLLWQSAYSEFYFCDAHWPAFRRVDFLRAIRSYQGRQRRYGR